MTIKRVVLSSLPLMFRASTHRPYSPAVSSEAMAASALSPRRATSWAARAVLALLLGKAQRFDEARALVQGLAGAKTPFHIAQRGARTPSRFCPTGRSVHITHAQLRVGKAKVQHFRNVAHAAVFKRQHAIFGLAVFHRAKHVCPRREAHGPRVGNSLRSAMWLNAPSTPW